MRKQLGGWDNGVPLDIGVEVLARCGSCGTIWDAKITNPRTSTGGVEIDKDHCPTCGGGYGAGKGLSVRSKGEQHEAN